MTAAVFEPVGEVIEGPLLPSAAPEAGAVNVTEGDVASGSRSRNFIYMGPIRSKCIGEATAR